MKEMQLINFQTSIITTKIEKYTEWENFSVKYKKQRIYNLSITIISSKINTTILFLKQRY